MLVRRFRFPQMGKSLAALVGLVLAGTTALAQSSDASGRSSPVAAVPQSASSQPFGEASAAVQVPRVAQTPQSAPGSAFSDLTGAITAPAPMDYMTPEAAGVTAPTPTTSGGASGFAGFGSAFAAGTGLAGQGATTAIADNVGYIDSAIIRSRVRVRFDANYGDTSPDKAEFIYPKCGCFANPLNFLQNGRFVKSYAYQNGYDPKARGPQHPVFAGLPASRFSGDPRVDYQEQSTYLEYAPVRNFSAFMELPARFINPTLVRDAAGFSDLNLGFKYAFVAEPNEYYTFQFRTYTPTGAPDLGLGTGHVSLEPAFLVFQRLSERLYFSGEFRDWIPVGGSNFAGNVLRYGLGLTYNIVLTDHFRIAPVNEIVGWTILSGKEFVATTQYPTGHIFPVAGQTIVNEKIGIRIGLGDYSQAGGGSALNDRHSLYVGYGRAITGDHWYRDTFRLEYNFWF